HGLDANLVCPPPPPAVRCLYVWGGGGWLLGGGGGGNARRAHRDATGVCLYVSFPVRSGRAGDTLCALSSWNSGGAEDGPLSGNRERSEDAARCDPGLSRLLRGPP